MDRALSVSQRALPEIVSPGQATFIFSVGTGFASVVANFIAARFADERGGLTSKQLLVGIGLTLAATVAAVWVMGRSER